MILDRLENIGQYLAVHPLMPAVMNFLNSNDLANLPPGRQEIDGSRLIVIADQSHGKGTSARLEAHRKYIDIQIPLDRDEIIGYRPTATCQVVAQDYNPEKDIAFYSDAVETSLTVPRGSFAMFFPQDAHAPLAIEGDIRKIIFKLQVEKS